MTTHTEHALNTKNYLRLKFPAWLYFMICGVIAIAPLLYETVFYYREMDTQSYLNTSFLLAFLGLLVLAIFTFPLGSLGSLTWAILILLGWVIPTEALVVSALVSVPLGYLQWFVLLPALYSRGTINHQ